MWSREWKGVEEDGRGGRRSNEPTSHGVVSTRAPLPLFSSFSSPLRLPASTFSLVLLLLLLSPSSPPPSPSRSASRSFSRVPRHYIIHISTLVFGNVVRRSCTRSFLPLCARWDARVTLGTCNLCGVRERYAGNIVSRERGIVLLLNFSFNGPRGNSRVTSSNSRQELRL